MIRLSVDVGEDHYRELEGEAQRRGQPLERVLAQKLYQTRHLPPEGRIVVLSQGQLDQLEGILAGGSVLNATDLVEKVARLAGISILHIRLPFTPQQLEQLQDRADRQGMTVEQLVGRAAPKIYEQFFNMTGG